MIDSLAHADRLVRYIASQINFRETVAGRTGTWQPTADPREVVRRWKLLDALGSDHMTIHEANGARSGNVLHIALADYVAALEAEVAKADADAKAKAKTEDADGPVH
jgi:hypothetical protein